MVTMVQRTIGILASVLACVTKPDRERVPSSSAAELSCGP
jgi:hypothetical protein